MSERDGSVSPDGSRSSRRSEIWSDRDETNIRLTNLEDAIRILLERSEPQRARTSDVGGFATPAEGSVGDPSEGVPTARPTSPTAAEAAIARHTVGFVPPPLPSVLPPVGVTPALPVGPAVTSFPTRPSRLELPIPDIDTASTRSSSRCQGSIGLSRPLLCRAFEDTQTHQRRCYALRRGLPS